MNLNTGVKLHNRFDILKIRDGEVIQRGVAENILLDRVYERLTAGYGYFNKIHFGSGNGSPTADRRVLFSPIGYKIAEIDEVIKSVPNSKVTRKIVLNPEEFVGDTITEVGISESTSEINSHAMIKDSEGNTLSITKSDIDVVVIYATVFVTLNLGAGIELTGMPDDNVLLKWLLEDTTPSSTVYFESGSCGLESTGEQVGVVSDYLVKTSNASFVQDLTNKKRTITHRFGITDGNGAVREIAGQNWFRLKMPALGVHEQQAFVNIEIGTGDGVEEGFKLPFNYVDDSTLVVKKDGVTTNDYVIDKFVDDYNFRYDSFDLFAENGRWNRGCGRFSTDGSTMVIANAYEYRSEPLLRIYDYIDGKFELKGLSEFTASYNYPPNDIFISDDKEKILVRLQNSAKNIKLFEKVDGKYEMIETDLFGDYIYAIFMNKEGTRIYTAYQVINIYEKVNGTWTLVDSIPNDSISYRYGLRVSDNEETILCVYSGTPYVEVIDKVNDSWLTRSLDVLPDAGDSSVSILTGDGNEIFVSNGDNAPYFLHYVRNGEAFEQQSSITGLDATGISYATINNNEDMIFISYGLTKKDYSVLSKVDGTWEYIGDFIHPDNDNRIATAERFTPNQFSFSPDDKIIVCGMYTEDYMEPVFVYNIERLKTKIKFNTPPAVNEVITADFSVDGIAKTEDYVVDVTMTLQFGEGA